MKEYGSILHRPQTVEFHRTAIEKIIRIMREDPGAALDWNELSRIACISRFHFLRIFEELTNTSPHRFLVALRMERAKRLLFETALSITDIGLRAGYRSAGTFVRVFKSLVGLTPGRLRQFRAELPASELKFLLSNYKQHCPQLNPLTHFQIDLRAPGPFTGLVCVGGFNSEALLDWPVRGTVVSQTYMTQLGLPGNAGGRVYGVGFLETASADSYFLPDQESVVVGSTRLPITHSSADPMGSVVLNLTKPSIFEPPILICLPLLLLKGGHNFTTTARHELPSDLPSFASHPDHLVPAEAAAPLHTHN